MCTDHDVFFTLIKNGWDVELGDLGLSQLARKLQFIKNSMRELNKNIFGNIENKIRELEQRFEFLEQDLQMFFSKDIETDFLNSKEEIARWMCR